MLFYISLYVVATLLVLQGTQLLGELSTPRDGVPAEVRPGPAPAARWGGFLVTFGAAMIVVGILSHGCDWFQGSLGLLRGFGVAIEALFGVWLVFGRKVDYAPAPGAPAPSHH